MSTEQHPEQPTNAAADHAPGTPNGAPGAADQPSPAQPVSGAVQPSWAKPQTQLVWQESPPLAYHQLLRGAAKYSWWRPLLALLLGTAYYLILSVIYMVAVLVPYFLISGQEFTEAAMLAVSVPDTREPVSMLLTLGSVALMLPSVWLAMLSTGLRPTGRVWSAALKIRWRWLGRTVLPAIGSLVVTNLVGMGLMAVGALLSPEAEASGDALSNAEISFDPTILLWSSLFILLLVPVQAAAEEVVFRGAFMQVIGAWTWKRGAGALAKLLRGPVLPILVPSILFGFAHIYDIWGWLAVVSMALAFGWLTWRTGGLEAAVTLHVINNLVAFGFMVAAVDGQTKQTAEGGNLPALIGLWAGLAFYIWVIERRFRNSGEHRTRIDYIQQAVPVSAPAPALPEQNTGAAS